ncbi:PLP-dependent aminotransferase family protein [Roseibium sp.]|uniref:MocR-like pyridoxine biosynthesis transcription factor PdxR n=1 Tax=Roseibium sp. TaxID=1936156 RepID=UPI003A9802A6
MKVPELPEGVLTLDRSLALPLSQQLYRAVRGAVSRGALKPGTRLPSSREIARRLGVSRNTVNAALELLQAETIITVAPGSAPVVAQGAVLEGAAIGDQSKLGTARLSERGKRQAENLRGDSWAFRHGALQPGAPALDVFPHDLWGRALRRAARKASNASLLYENAMGHPALTSVLAEYLSAQRGVRVEPDQILITGSMQGILSGLSEALADPGDWAWLEDPGYLGARTAFHGAGLRMKGIPVDDQGAAIEAMQGCGPAPKLIYVTPSHQYPFGTRMPLARRLALIEAARSMGGVILEDDYDSEFLFEGRPVSALQGLAGDGEVIYMGTFSKSLLPGLRVSYCVVPHPLVDDLGRALRQGGRVANVHTQIALADFIESGEYRAHLKRIRSLYEERGHALVDGLRRQLGNLIDVEIPTGNVQVALKFRVAVDDEALARQLQARGFSVSPLSPCFLDAPAQSGLIVGFAAATADQIADFTRLLSDLLDLGSDPT